MKLLEPSSPAFDHPRKKAIHEWDTGDRPREKFMNEGADALSPAELLAILVGSGNDREDAVTLMQRLLDDCRGSLKRLGKRSIEELCAYRGIGPAKAVTVLAACELGARRHTEDADTEQFDCSQKIYRFFYEKLRDAPVEEAHVLLLNNNLRFIRSVQVCRGGIDSTTVDVRIVLREALVSNAVHIALCDNHLPATHNLHAPTIISPTNCAAPAMPCSSASSTTSFSPMATIIVMPTPDDSNR